MTKRKFQYVASANDPEKPVRVPEHRESACVLECDGHFLTADWDRTPNLWDARLYSQEKAQRVLKAALAFEGGEFANAKILAVHLSPFDIAIAPVPAPKAKVRKAKPAPAPKRDKEALDLIPCPDCGGELLLRMPRKGGKQFMPFYGCCSYPACSGSLSVREYEEAQAEQLGALTDVDDHWDRPY